MATSESNIAAQLDPSTRDFWHKTQRVDRVIVSRAARTGIQLAPLSEPRTALDVLRHAAAIGARAARVGLAPAPVDTSPRVSIESLRRVGQELRAAGVIR